MCIVIVKLYVFVLFSEHWSGFDIFIAILNEEINK